MHNVLVEDWCAAGTSGGAAIDIRGPALLSDIMLRRSITNIAADCVGIRMRAGEIGNVNGVGGNYCKVTNFHIMASGPMLGCGVNTEGNRVSFCNGYIAHCNIGVHIEQESVSVSNVSLFDCGTCIYSSTINNPGYGITVPANYALINNVSCEQSNTGIHLTTNNCVVTGCLFRSLQTGLRLTGTGTVQGNNCFVATTTNVTNV